MSWCAESSGSLSPTLLDVPSWPRLSMRPKEKCERVWRKISAPARPPNATSAEPNSQLARHHKSSAEMVNAIAQIPLFVSPAHEGTTHRRTLRRQRYLGSIELLVSVDTDGKIRNMGRFRIEPAELDSNRAPAFSVLASPVILENPEIETRWYFKYFLGKGHTNYAAVDNQKQPLFLSTVVDEGSDGNLLRHRAILWTAKGATRLSIPYNYPKGSSPKNILRSFEPMRDTDCALRQVEDPRLQKDLLILEEQEGSVNFKFGVVMARSNQDTDYEMLANEYGTKVFDNFIALLGERIRLWGWPKYKGGLDTKSDTTGTDSVYTVFEGHEIMFHVSTLLPHSTVNVQQVERKRHIGNDIVNIIFEDADDPDHPTFNPSMLKSHFTHIVALVTYNTKTSTYRLWVFSEESVPPFGPALALPQVFTDPSQFRDFLLTKLINGEKAAFHSQVFAEKRQRTMDLLIKDMYIEYMKNCDKSLSRVDSVLGKNRLKKQAELDQKMAEFINVGQALKLEKVLSGDAPSSVAASGICRNRPWEPLRMPPDLPWNVTAGDSWNSSFVLLASEKGGLFFLNIETGPAVPVIEAGMTFKQITVLEQYNLVFLRSAQKGKDEYFYVTTLGLLQQKLRLRQIIERSEMKEYRAESSKGCHLYAVSHGLQLRLHVAVAVGSHIRILQWRFALPQADSPGSRPLANFDLLRDLSFIEDPMALDIFNSKGLHLCVGYKHQFELLNIREAGDSKILLYTDTKITTATVTDYIDLDQCELLITYNNISVILDLSNEESLPPIKMYWNSTPISVSYFFPFVISFTGDTIEIRLAINGSLLTTLYMPDLSFITAKSDILFGTSAASNSNANLSSEVSRRDSVASKISESMKDGGLSTLPQKRASVGPDERSRKLYRIPIDQLLGSTATLGGSTHVLPDASPKLPTAHAVLSKQMSNPPKGSNSTKSRHGLCSSLSSSTNRDSLQPSNSTHVHKPVQRLKPPSSASQQAQRRLHLPRENSQDSGLSSQNSLEGTNLVPTANLNITL